jgi:glyoxylase-like metal-dependent hydrolase (beta-lactamase superfamily II)
MRITASFPAFTAPSPAPPSGNESPASRPELEYLEVVNEQGPPRDPQLLFLLMAEYANANLHERGINFFSTRLKEFDDHLTDGQRALYTSALGLLRAQHAPSVSLLHRIGYVNDTIALLQQAKQLSAGQVFVVNWIMGIVYTRLPGVFHHGKAAHDELTWCLANADKAPHAGWLREVYRHLALLADANGDQAKAQDYLQKSGYTDLNLPITLSTPFSEETASGHTFAPQKISEVVPRRVYALTGFEFTEYYFVVSDDGRELIGIDAGTRPDSAKAAYEALRAHDSSLPELTTIFVTHSHWDHVGGHAYFRGLNPRLRFFARSNYQDQISRGLAAPFTFEQSFFGSRYSADEVRGFKPDVLVDKKTELSIGGTRFELIPVLGGETRDAMFIHVPELGVLFVGDFIMPYIGAPFVPEGDLPGLFDAIDLVVKIGPKHLLHGHEPLTTNFPSAAVLAQVKADLGWLRDQVADSVRKGQTRAAIHGANLIPPALRTGEHDIYLPYLVLREHVIDRVYSQSVGYWQADLQGMDHLGREDRGELFVHYFDLSEQEIAAAAKRLAEDGKYELAAYLLDSCHHRFASSEDLSTIERLVYLKLMEKYQNHDPFKFIIYASKAGAQLPQMPVTPQ